MIIEEFKFSSLHATPQQGHQLAATSVLNIDGDPPAALLLHGMHESGRHVFAALADQLAKAGIGSLRFDQPGWGESTVSKDTQTLKNYIGNAAMALRHMDEGRADILIGHSMGGFIAAMLLNFTKPKALVLFAPAPYPSAALDIPLDDNFGAIARAPDAWRASPAFKALQDYTGQVLLIMGEADDLIPLETVAAWDAACPNATFESYIIPGAPHALQGWLQLPENEDIRQQVIEKIAVLVE